jgi:regulator of sirC expression with transglutaminase-like and TPR domain
MNIGNKRNNNLLRRSYDDNIVNILESNINIYNDNNNNIIYNDESIQKALKKWAIEEQEDLLKGILILSRYQYPDLNETKIRKDLGQIKQDVWLELNDDLTAIEKVKVLNHILFEVHQFSGNITNYHAPQNSFINNVLESKKGNPLMLSVLYMLICKELNIPIYGINLPQHFVLAYLNDNANLIDVNNKTLSNNILFYINPFSKGLIFNQKDIDQFLKQLNLPKLDFESIR